MQGSLSCLCPLGELEHRRLEHASDSSSASWRTCYLHTEGLVLVLQCGNEEEEPHRRWRQSKWCHNQPMHTHR